MSDHRTHSLLQDDSPTRESGVHYSGNLIATPSSNALYTRYWFCSSPQPYGGTKQNREQVDQGTQTNYRGALDSIK